MIDYKAEENLILCGNQDFIIKVDKLQNQKIRYACWRKPKHIFDAPDLILLNGYVRFFEQFDKYEFVFPFGKWTYVIEQIITKDESDAAQIFLEVSDGGNEKSTWKMQDMKESGGYSSLI